MLLYRKNFKVLTLIGCDLNIPNTVQVSQIRFSLSKFSKPSIKYTLLIIKQYQLVSNFQNFSPNCSPICQFRPLTINCQTLISRSWDCSFILLRNCNLIFSRPRFHIFSKSIDTEEISYYWKLFMSFKYTNRITNNWPILILNFLKNIINDYFTYDCSCIITLK